MNPGSIPCPNCGAAWDEPCAAWCADGTPDGVDERVNHLANREMDGSADRVANPLVSAVPDGLGFE